MKEMLRMGLVAIGAVALYLGLKEQIGAFAQLHPYCMIVIGLGLILGADAISTKIFRQE